MRKKTMAYLGLFIIVSAFFAAPISAIAEVLNQAEATMDSNILKGENEQNTITSDSSINSKSEKTEATNSDSLLNENTLDSDQVKVEKGLQTENTQKEELTPKDASYAKVTLKLEPNKEGNKYLTGEKIQFYHTIEFSGEKLEKEPYSLIEIPKEFVDKESIEIHGDDNQTYQILDEKPDSWTIRIDYKGITSGGIVSLPITFNQKNYKTPSGSETKVSTGLYVEEDFLAGDSFSVYAETVKASLEKRVQSSATENKKIDIGFPSKDNKEMSSTDLKDLNRITYELIVKAGTREGYGIYNGDYGLVTDQLPKEAQLAEASMNGGKWNYDEKTHSVSYLIPEDTEFNYDYISLPIEVYFPDTKENEPILNQAELSNRQGEVVAKDSITFIPTLKSIPKYIPGKIYKKAHGNTQSRYIGETPDDIIWDVVPTINTYKLENQESYITEIEDILDNDQDYSKVRISVAENVEYDFINLYGAKSDGKYQLIQEKMLIDEDVSLGKEYRKIKVVFNKPVKLIDNDSIKLTLTTRVKDDVWAKGMEGKTIFNRGEVSYTDLTGELLKVEGTHDTVTYKGSSIKFHTTIDTKKVVDGYINNTKSLHYNLSFKNIKDGEEVVIVSVLPNGAIPILDNDNFTVIHNYLNTGKTAVIQKVIVINDEGTPANLSIKLSGTLAKGEHEIQHYVYWETESIKPETWNNSYIIHNNPLDFDGLGTFVGRAVLADMDRIKYYPPLEVVISKKIGSSPQNLSEMPLEISYADDIYYGIDLENRTAQPIENFYYYDILPFFGDQVSDQKNQATNGRGSTNSVVFSGIVSQDENLDIYYSSEQNIENLKTTLWQKLENDTPMHQVKSLKVVPKKKLEPNQKMSIVFKVKANEFKETSIVRNGALLSRDTQDGLVDSNIVEAKILEKDLRTVKGTKVWEDENNKSDNRPFSIRVKLLADGAQVASKEVNEKSDWKFEFNNLPKVKNGEEIQYTVEEVKVQDYETNIDDSDKENIKIINTYKPELIEIKGAKTWNDYNDLDGKRPETITVNLMAKGKQVATKEVSAKDEWKYKFEGFPKYQFGKEIAYTVIENPVPEYQTAISGFNIINTHEMDKRNITVTKEWLDNEDEDGKRPRYIDVQLKGNGKDIGRSVLLRESDNWQYTWEDVPKTVNGKEVVYTVEEEKVKEYETIVDNSDQQTIKLTNTYKPETISVKGKKTWTDNNNKDGNRPDKIIIHLQEDGKTLATKEVTEADNWEFEFKGLTKIKHDMPVNYRVIEEKVPYYKAVIDDREKDNVKILNIYLPEKVAVKGVKTWEDNNDESGNRPKAITVNLFADGTEIENKEVSEATDWKYEFTNLPKHQNGHEVIYTVTENSIDDYTTKVDGYNITNTYNPGKTSVTVTKQWEDNNNKDGSRPESIKVQLLANGNKQGDAVELGAGDNWSYTWNELNQKAKGKDIIYSIEEVSVPNYKVTLDDTDKGNIKLMNALVSPEVPDTTEVKGTKTWNDKDNQAGIRPEVITVNLLADGKEIDEKEVTEAGNWQYEFTELPKYQNGEEILYTVTENQVPEYQTMISGFDITNSYTPGKTSVTVTKEWVDNNNQDGMRPNDISIQLLANGEKQGKEIKLTAVDNWSYTWNDLAQKVKGKDVVYKIKEISVPEYTISIDDTDKGNIKLVNTHVPATTEVKGTKMWNDKDNQAGIRPDKITVNLLADGKEIDKKEVTEAGNWQYEFTELPKYQNGEEILYTVTENQVPEYQTTISGFDITNSYTPGKRSVTVTKGWNDSDNRDGKRPNAIRVQLLANGEEHGEVITLSASNRWQFTWSDLAEKAKGKHIAYTIKEMAVSGYESEVDNRDTGNIKLVNTHLLETTEVKGTKTWDDKDDKAGIRPEKITVNLLADGKQVAQREVTEAGNWQYEFTELPKYQNGTEIVYTVTENEVPEYQSSISGYDITNTYTPGKTSVTVTKEWIDNNNQDGMRPNDITVQLLANGEKQGEEIKLTATDKWSHTWNNLDQKVKGKEIVYTVEETKVPSYITSIDDTDKGNIKLVNTHLVETTEVKGTKTWKDNNNQAGKRPEKITINLLANGKQVNQKEVAEQDNWQYDFTNLEKYQNGEEILYTVTEQQVPDYQSKVSGYDITNTYTPGKTNTTVTKEWVDNNDQDHIRPESIKVQLLANGEKQGEEVVITKNDKWVYEWSDLEMLDKKGQPISYTVREVDVPKGYTVTYKENTSGSLGIVNVHTPKTPDKPTPPTTPKTGGVLPKTGENRTSLLPLLGLVTIVLVSRVTYVKRKKE